MIILYKYNYYKMNTLFENKTSKQINDFYLDELKERKTNNTTQIFSYDDIYSSNSDTDNDIQLSEYHDSEIDELINEFKKLNKDDKCIIMKKIKELNQKN